MADPGENQGVRRVAILGSTGSIGRQALDVIARSDEIEVVALGAGGGSWQALAEQARRHGVSNLAVAQPTLAEPLRRELDGASVQAGGEALERLIEAAEPDLVLNAVVGAAGLGPTIYALSHGIDVALANKESLVVGGDLVMALAASTGARLIPVDSEHSALFQLIAAEPPGTIDSIELTASGGPFRGRSDLEGVTLEEALAHPTWSMGGKITIDSATLMNKGLEVIEAHHLFGLAYERIDVVVHPQSIVHSIVHLNDGASLAHLGYPSMEVPIAYALHYPERADVPVDRLDLAAVGRLDFERPDLDTFPCLRLAREAGAAGGTAPCVLNAANEVAVQAFLDGRIPFVGIPGLIEQAMIELPARIPGHFTDLFDADEAARTLVEKLVARPNGAPRAD